MNTMLTGHLILSFLMLVGILLFRFFYRDPDRRTPPGDVLVAPADGKVLGIVDIEEGAEVNIDKGLLGRIRTVTADMGAGPFRLVSIFMSPMVVHVQRVPIDGTIERVEHRAGAFRITNTIRAIDNERTETMIDSPIGKVKVIQIAGWLVRRIETWTDAGRSVIAGQRLGRIAFGSQVSLIIPKTDAMDIKVKKGQRVKAGETVIAEYRKGDLT